MLVPNHQCKCHSHPSGNLLVHAASQYQVVSPSDRRRVWKSTALHLIDMQKHAERAVSFVIIGVQREEVWRRLPHASLSAAHKHAHTLTPATAMSLARWVPGDPANRLSGAVVSPINLTRDENARAVGDGLLDLGVAHRCTFGGVGFPSSFQASGILY